MRAPHAPRRPTKPFAALRRRRYWAAAVACIAIAVTAALVSSTEPAYRATASLRIDGRTLPADLGGAELSRYAAEHLQARYGRVIDAAGPEFRRASLTVTEVTTGEATAGAPASLSVAFDIVAEGRDERAAASAASRLVAAFLDEDARTAAAPAVPAEQLEAARAEAETSGTELRTLEEQLDAFGRSNAAGLPGLQDAHAEAIRRGERERTELDQRIGALEARKIELDRGLRDMQRGAADYRAGSGQPLTSEMLAALQARWAVLRGRYGEDHPDAVALGTQIRDAQAEVEQRLDAVTAEQRDAQLELERLERLHPIDHPDVVGASHRVSALEAQAERIRVTGLTGSERAYIEGLARERRDIDGQLAQLRDDAASLQARMADYAARAEQAPALQREYDLLHEQVAAARARHEAALAQQAALQARQDAARQQQPGRLTTVAAPSAVRLLFSRPAVIAGVGGVAGLLAMLLVVALVERIDRRIAGAATIARLQGSLPIAEIPALS